MYMKLEQPSLEVAPITVVTFLSHRGFQMSSFLRSFQLGSAFHPHALTVFQLHFHYLISPSHPDRIWSSYDLEL